MPGCIFPSWFDTKNPEAQRGTKHLRAVDPNLLVGFDTRRGCFTICGPSLSAQTWVPLTDCEDDRGRFYRGFVPWERIAVGIKQAMDDAARGRFTIDRVMEHNQKLDAQKDAEFAGMIRDSMRYACRAIAVECDGASRWSPQDVAEGFRMARDGRSKRAPVGRKIFAPQGK